VCLPAAWCQQLCTTCMGSDVLPSLCSQPPPCIPLCSLLSMGGAPSGTKPRQQQHAMCWARSLPVRSTKMGFHQNKNAACHGCTCVLQACAGLVCPHGRGAAGWAQLGSRGAAEKRGNTRGATRAAVIECNTDQPLRQAAAASVAAGGRMAAHTLRWLPAACPLHWLVVLSAGLGSLCCLVPPAINFPCMLTLTCSHPLPGFDCSTPPLYPLSDFQLTHFLAAWQRRTRTVPAVRL